MAWVAPSMDRSLLYVSRKLITAAEEESSMADIVAGSESRNTALNVTGALVSTAAHFAQILEGPAVAIDELMESIHRDGRHADITVLRLIGITRRSFPDWSLAYSGPSTYLARHVAPLVGADPWSDVTRIDRLIGLLTGFAGKAPGALV